MKHLYLLNIEKLIVYLKEGILKILNTIGNEFKTFTIEL